jgi:hypothetical protein
MVPNLTKISATFVTSCPYTRRDVINQILLTPAWTLNRHIITYSFNQFFRVMMLDNIKLSAYNPIKQCSTQLLMRQLMFTYKTRSLRKVEFCINIKTGQDPFSPHILSNSTESIIIHFFALWKTTGSGEEVGISRIIDRQQRLLVLSMFTSGATWQ